MRRRGAALIIVLGVLALLSTVGITFAQISSLDRRLSRNYMDEVRARLVTRSGIESAVAGLQDPDVTRYLGSADLCGRMIQLDNEWVPIAGAVDGSYYAPNGDCYRLRVVDANSLLFVNDGLELGALGPVSQNMARILDILGTNLGVPSAGQRIMQGRPREGYATSRQLEAVLGRKDYLKIGQFLTTHAWVDTSVCLPVPISASTISSYPVKPGATYRYGGMAPLVFAPEHADGRGQAHRIAGMDELNAQWIGMCSRAPVNVNLAPREILVALLTGLKGTFVLDRRLSFPAKAGDAFLHPTGPQRSQTVGYLYSTKEITPEMAGRIADRMFGRQFKSWPELESFFDRLASDILVDDRDIYFDYVDGSTSRMVASETQRKYAERAMADALKANFNPNCTLNELNPDRWSGVDKTDLICNSTEFCLQPMGVFKIDCEGFVTRTPGGKDLFETGKGDVVARYAQNCIVKTYDVWRDTSQADFSAGRFYQPRALEKTNNARTFETGPEPDNGPGPGECRFGGWMQLPTMGGGSSHVPGARMASPPGSSERGAVAVGHFEWSHDLNLHAGGRSAALGVSGSFQNNPGPNNPAKGDYRLARSYDMASEKPSGRFAPSDLRLDGGYVERGCSMMYKSTPEVMGRVGTVSYWMKLGYDMGLTGRPRTLFSMNTKGANEKPLILGNWFLPVYTDDAFAPSGEALPWNFVKGPWKMGVLLAGYSIGRDQVLGPSVQAYPPEPDESERHPDWRQPILPHGRWNHVIFHWDFDQRLVEFYLNGAKMGDASPMPEDWDEKMEQDWQGFVSGDAVFRLGEPSSIRGPAGKLGTWSADSTFDEFYMWKGRQVDTALSIRNEGRYYAANPTQPAFFDSRTLDVRVPATRLPPPAFGADDPDASEDVRNRTLIRVLGAKVTWFEGGGRWQTPIHRDVDPPPPRGRFGGRPGPARAPKPKLTMSFLVNGQELPPALQEYGPGAPVEEEPLPYAFPFVKPFSELKYRLMYQNPFLDPGVPNFSTPVIDDVTVFYTTGTEFLSWQPGVYWR